VGAPAGWVAGNGAVVPDAAGGAGASASADGLEAGGAWDGAAPGAAGAGAGCCASAVAAAEVAAARTASDERFRIADIEVLRYVIGARHYLRNRDEHASFMSHMLRPGCPGTHERDRLDESPYPRPWSMPPNSSTAHRWFRVARWLGAALLAWSAVMLTVLPRTMGPLPAGFRTPILAFELARTPDEVETMFGPPGSADRASWVRAMDLGNTLDFVFMVLYAAQLAALAAGFARLRGRVFLVSGGLAIAGALCDAAENVQLFAITRSLGGDYAMPLGRLRVFTWLKWELLALAIAWLAAPLSRGSATEKVVGLMSAAVGVLGAMAYLDRAGFAETFALFVSMAFIGLWIVAFQRSAREAT